MQQHRRSGCVTTSTVGRDDDGRASVNKSTSCPRDGQRRVKENLLPHPVLNFLPFTANYGELQIIEAPSLKALFSHSKWSQQPSIPQESGVYWRATLARWPEEAETRWAINLTISWIEMIIINIFFDISGKEKHRRDLVLSSSPSTNIKVLKCDEVSHSKILRVGIYLTICADLMAPQMMIIKFFVP